MIDSWPPVFGPGATVVSGCRGCGVRMAGAGSLAGRWCGGGLMGGRVSPVWPGGCRWRGQGWRGGSGRCRQAGAVPAAGCVEVGELRRRTPMAPVGRWGPAVAGAVGQVRRRRLRAEGGCAVLRWGRRRDGPRVCGGGGRRWGCVPLVWSGGLPVRGAAVDGARATGAARRATGAGADRVPRTWSAGPDGGGGRRTRAVLGPTADARWSPARASPADAQPAAHRRWRPRPSSMARIPVSNRASYSSSVVAIDHVGGGVRARWVSSTLTSPCIVVQRR